MQILQSFFFALSLSLSLSIFFLLDVYVKYLRFCMLSTWILHIW